MNPPAAVGLPFCLRLAMDRIIDYVQWYKDVPFSVVPFSEVDNLVLCALSYWKMSPLLHCQGSMSLKQCFDALEGSSVEMMTTDTDPTMKAFVALCSASKRYGSLLISDYVDEFYPEVPIQFSAVTFHLNEKTKYIAFRGTDSSIAGWKEDFMISFTETRAQQMSLEYLKEHILPGMEYYVGGHSKGGNQALYAAALLPQAQQQQIARLYINDGPGLCKEVLDPSAAKALDDRAIMIRPEYCVIGKIFQAEFSQCRIVKSTQKGPMQHSIFSWGIQGGALALSDGYDPQSEAIDRMLDRWLEKVSMEERKTFTDSIFSAMEKDGSKTLFDVMENWPTSLENMVVSVLDGDQAAKEAIKKLPRAAVTGNAAKISRQMKQEVEHQPYLADAAIALAGVLLLLLPSSFFNLAMAGALLIVLAWEAYTTVRQLQKNRWDAREERTRITLCLIMFSVFLLILVKEQALFLLSSILFGFLLLWYGYYTGAKIKQDRKHGVFYWLHFAEALLSVILGVFILVAPQRTIHGFSISVGILLILDAATHAIIRLLQIKNLK